MWLLQDLLQVLIMGFSLVPDIYMLMLLGYALFPATDDAKLKKIIWATFFGGMLWDLRWTNLPGLTSCLGVIIIWLVNCYWRKVPAQGRSPVLFAFLLFVAQLALTLVNYMFWTIPNHVALRLISVQILLVIPLIIVGTCLYKKVFENYV